MKHWNTSLLTILKTRHKNPTARPIPTLKRYSAVPSSMLLVIKATRESAGPSKCMRWAGLKNTSES